MTKQSLSLDHPVTRTCPHLSQILKRIEDEGLFSTRLPSRFSGFLNSTGFYNTYIHLSSIRLKRAVQPDNGKPLWRRDQKLQTRLKAKEKGRNSSWKRENDIEFVESLKPLIKKTHRQEYLRHARKINKTNGRVKWFRTVLIIVINLSLLDSCFSNHH